MASGVTRQEALLRQALTEAGLPLHYRVDHINGRSYLEDGREVGLIYPKSWFDRTAALPYVQKQIRFFFAGDMRSRGGRHGMIRRFVAGFPSQQLSITDSRWGKRPENKDVFDLDNYYFRLAQSEFGLCPHHLDWGGPRDTVWTYRFIDCVMVGTIPVLFEATPLADSFVEGFRYVWDDDGTYGMADPDAWYTFRKDFAFENRALAEDRFTL